MNILLIEDEPLIRKSLTKLLERAGATVTDEALGNKALEHIQDGNFDRIVCDLMLSDITGFDIIESTKQYFTPEKISSLFIIITAYSSDQVLERAQNYNCKLIQKPFSNINDVITQIMDQS